MIVHITNFYHQISLHKKIYSLKPINFNTQKTCNFQCKNRIKKCECCPNQCSHQTEISGQKICAQVFFWMLNRDEHTETHTHTHIQLSFTSVLTHQGKQSKYTRTTTTLYTASMLTHTARV